MLQAPTFGKFEWSLWPALLIATAAISTLGFACVTPFAAFAVAAAYVLPMRRALFCIAGVWLANQAIGFAALNYPLTLEALLWGLAIGLAAILAAAVASLVLRQRTWNVILGLAAALGAAFVVYEAVLLLASLGLGGGEAFTPAIIGQFALLNVVWALGLVGTREALRQTGIGGVPLALGRR